MKRTVYLSVVLAFLLAIAVAPLTGCASPAAAPDATESGTPAEAPGGAFPVTVTDDAAREVTIDTEPLRIVSLAPSNTEIVAALGLLDRVVGVTTSDDYPAGVADIAVIGDFAAPNLEAVAAAQPDLILATTGVQGEMIAQLEGLGADVVAVDPQNLEELFASIEMVGAVTGATTQSAALTASMRAELAEIRELLGDAAPVRSFIEIAQNPLFTAGAGTLIDDLIAAAGGVNVVEESGWVAYSVEQVVADNPDVYLATRGSMSNPEDLAQRPGFQQLAAVQAGRVHVLDDNLVSRPGPRVIEGVRSIAEALHPEAFANAQ